MWTLVALCAVGPDHAHGGAVLAGVGHDVGGAAVGACGSPSHAAYSSSAWSTMSLPAAMWDSGVESVNGSRRTAAAWASSASYPGCEYAGSPARYPAAGTTASRVPPRPGDGAGEDLVGPVGQAGQSGHAGSVLGEGRADGLVDQARGPGGQAPVP